MKTVIAAWLVVAAIFAADSLEPLVVSESPPAPTDVPVVQPVEPPVITPTNPENVAAAPALITFDQVMGYQKRYIEKQEQYLRQGGWVKNSDTVGAFNFWALSFRGKEYRMELEPAVYVQRAVEDVLAQEALERKLQQSTGVQ